MQIPSPHWKVFGGHGDGGGGAIIRDQVLMKKICEQNMVMINEIL